MKLSEVTAILDGELISDGEFSRLDYCTVKSEDTFLSFMENLKFLPMVQANPAVSCVLCKRETVDSLPPTVKGIFVTDEPKAGFEMIHNSLENNSEYRLPDFDNEIDESAKISPLAYIAPKSIKIGKNVVIEPFAYIGEQVTIGDNCIIHSHCAIGAKSFSYARRGTDDIIGLKDYGRVVIDDGAEIMCHGHIASGILPTDITYIGKNTVLDAFAYIGHGTKLKNRVFVAAGVTIGGNSVVNDDVWIGINATVSNRIVVGKKARVSLGSVVTKNVDDGMTVSGNFAIEHSRFIENVKKSAGKAE